MPGNIYRELYETLAKRRGRYPGKDIPEFYTLVKELFTPEVASGYNAIPNGFQLLLVFLFHEHLQFGFGVHGMT